MPRHLFVKVGEEPWKDVGRDLLDKFAYYGDEAILGELRGLAELTDTSKPAVLYELREVAEKSSATP